MAAEHRRVAQRFEDPIAWKRARELTRTVFAVTANERVSRNLRFCGQIEAASVSTMSNIAEGFDRGLRSEFSRFLVIAKGSCGEVRSMTHVALDAGFIDRPTFDRLMSQTDELASVISGLRASVDRQRVNDWRARKARSHAAKPASRNT